jgi:hypothetical protein
MTLQLVIDSHFVTDEYGYQKADQKHTEETDRHSRVCIDVGLSFYNKRAIQVRAV